MKDFKESFYEAVNLLPYRLSNYIKESYKDSMQVFEVRLTNECNPLIITDKGIIKAGCTVTLRDLEESVLSLTGNSYHSFQKEMADGYIPLKNGHRAGLAGTAVYERDGRIVSLKNITTIVLRIANDVNLKNNPLFEDLSRTGIYSAVISGPPCSGKTTFLRDTAKKLSAMGCSVAVVDERQELFAGLKGCAVIKGAEKPKGIEMAVKSLSPRILICDEISSPREAEAVAGALNSGVGVLASLHAKNYQDFKNKKTAQILTSTNEFKKAVFLSTFPNIGEINETVDLI